MWNRGQRDTDKDQIYNRNVFHTIWGSDIYPKCDYNLAEMNAEILVKFGYLKQEVFDLISERDRLYKELLAMEKTAK